MGLTGHRWPRYDFHAHDSRIWKGALSDVVVVMVELVQCVIVSANVQSG